MKKNDLKGINVRTDDNSSVVKNYAISGIPSYFLIDKSGNFAVSKVSDPSDEDGKTLIQQIEEILTRND
jgi:hypothetical protein